MKETPHERSYECRKLEIELRRIDLEIENLKYCANDPETRLSIELMNRFLFLPLTYLDRSVKWLNYRLAKFNDGHEDLGE